jgi:hypothetical protein
MNGKRPYTPFKQVVAGGLFSTNRTRGSFNEKDLQEEQLRIRRMIDDASRYNKPIDPKTKLYGQMIGATGFGSAGRGAASSVGVFRPEEVIPLIREYDPNKAPWWSQTPQYQFPMMR